jgi:hypothetical protein
MDAAVRPWLGGSMVREVDADYLVVGAGATGMAFTDALIANTDGARVALVDRRHGVGGHWLGAYPFVRLHQSSCFYGVASTTLGGGRLQSDGPEAGLQERAGQAAICSYYADVLVDRLQGSGRVDLYSGCEYVGDRIVVSRVSGRRYEVAQRCRVVDARYLAPVIPSESQRRYRVDEGANVFPVNELVGVPAAPSAYVIVGSGKTATDAIVWLLAQGVDPDAVCWIRPRDPWMLNRALIQPEPEIYQGMVADLLQSATEATSLDDWFLRLEDLGVMLRVDRSATPTMAKAPTLGVWELEQLRTIENVVRLGHVRAVSRGRIDLEHGSVAIPHDAAVVDCAADGLRSRPTVPIWGPDAITPQPIRPGFPCFGAALAGYVEATRGDDVEKNRLCPPSAFGNTLADWATMNLVGIRNTMSFSSEPDIKDWSNRVALNPARIPPDHPGSPQLDAALERIAEARDPALASLERLVRSDR